MTEYLVGTGGWEYFNLSKKPSLKAYSEIFNFTEVNHTFYEYPEPRVVERWRRIVPKDFTFAVRCHQDLTHRIGLKPVDEAYEVLGRMMTYCGILEAPYLVLETPQSYKFDDRAIHAARDFFLSANLKDVMLVWEVRGGYAPDLIDLLRDFKIVHSVDLSKQEPSLSSDVVYTRLFGKGKHNIYQFTDEELVEIDNRALKTRPKIVAMAYHGLRMNTDALRFSTYKKTGTFAMATSYTGAESVRAVLSEDGQFPTSKQSLIEDQGWKVVDLKPESRVHLSDLLRKIPEKTYRGVDEVVYALEEIL